MVTRMGGYLAVLLIVLPIGMAAAFLGVQLAVLGLYLGCTFAPSHKGMPILGPDTNIDFLRRQVLMSRNITGSHLITAAMGGLNYQIEHHLFPSMPGPNLHRAQGTVRGFCRHRGVPYTETSLLRSYGIVVRYLNRVGLRGEVDTFQCPLVTAHRPRD
jgi:fatty acid desaturase